MTSPLGNSCAHPLMLEQQLQWSVEMLHDLMILTSHEQKGGRQGKCW